MREWTRAMDCHDFAGEKSRNDKQKVDSNDNAQNLQAEAVEMRNCGFQSGSEESYLSGSNRADTAESAIYRSNATPKQKVDSSKNKGDGNA